MDLRGDGPYAFEKEGGLVSTTVLTLREGTNATTVLAELARRGCKGTIVGDAQQAIVVRGPLDAYDMDGVEHVWTSASRHPRVDDAPPVVRVGNVDIGRERVWIAGPCAVEDAETLDRIAGQVAAAGAKVLRGGAFKPRTSPYSFHGLGEAGLELLRRSADRYGLAVVTEVMSVPDVPAVAEMADLVQIGSRSMQHFPLLDAVGRTGKPVMLKRGASATIQEWLLAAEYLLHAGSSGVVLCERGIRAFDQPTRYTLDLGGVAWLLEHTHLPVVVDPSHATGRRELVPRLAAASVAVGAHAIMVDVHLDPGSALCDGPQAIDPATFATLVREHTDPREVIVPRVREVAR